MIAFRVVTPGGKRPAARVSHFRSAEQKAGQVTRSLYSQIRMEMTKFETGVPHVCPTALSGPNIKPRAGVISNLRLEWKYRP